MVLVQCLTLLPLKRVNIANDPRGSDLLDGLWLNSFSRRKSFTFLGGLLVDVLLELSLVQRIFIDLELLVLCVPLHLDLITVEVGVNALFENLCETPSALDHLEKVDKTDQSHWHDDTLGFGPPEDVHVFSTYLRVELVFGFDVGLVDVDFAGGVH